MDAIKSRGLKLGTKVDHPVPMPSAPLTSAVGMSGTYHDGSMLCPSSSR